MIALLFWFLIFSILYSYFGYVLILLPIYFIKKLLKKTFSNFTETFEPQVTILLAAYNEKKNIPDKVQNLLELDYPSNKIKFIWVTDGSTDGSQTILSQYPQMQVYHEDGRKGKIGAINRVMPFINDNIVILCDANNFLSRNSIKAIVKEFADPKVGCVAGEKKIMIYKNDIAASSGEGFYWHYESLIKKVESSVNSTIGAAGEIFAIRKELFKPVEPDTILDDFVISLRIAAAGYKVKYTAQAIAIETSSASISDELKRKIRIAAGSFQTLFRLKEILNPFKFGFLSIQYWSHKVIRWTLVPIAFPLAFFFNMYLANTSENNIYSILMYLQYIFYFFALIGFLFRNKKTKVHFLFLPFYLLLMNYAIILGFVRFVKGKQSVNWEKAKRS